MLPESGIDRGASPVVGILLMMTLTVILGATVAVFLLPPAQDLQEGPDAEPSSTSDSAEPTSVADHTGDTSSDHTEPLLAVTVDTSAIVVLGMLVASVLGLRSPRVWRAGGRIREMAGQHIPDDDPSGLESVQERYVEGDLTDVEFEAELEGELATEMGVADDGDQTGEDPDGA